MRNPKIIFGETTYNINYKSYHDKNMAGGINIIQEIDASLDMSQ